MEKLRGLRNSAFYWQTGGSRGCRSRTDTLIEEMSGEQLRNKKVEKVLSFV